MVLVDFGAFNLRLAQTLRRLRYRGPIVYYFPPGAWLDNAKQARRVAAVASPLTPFTHQRDFYAAQGREIAYFGHPLVSAFAPRAARAPAPRDGGVVALLPGSRRGELSRHGPLMLRAARALRATRPALEVILAAADEDAAVMLRTHCSQAGIDATIVDGVAEAFARADVACIASGTAVLEAALCEIPAVATYVLSAAQARIARRVYRGRWITLPNLVSGTEIVPERLQDDATPEQLCADLERLLLDPSEQLAHLRTLRPLLGPHDAIDRIAEHLLAVASTR